MLGSPKRSRHWFVFSRIANDSGWLVESKDNRRAPRHALIVDVVVTDMQSGIQIRERTKDLNCYGCGVSTATPFVTGTKVMLNVNYGQEKITAFGKVIYARTDIGMGIVFSTIEPKDQRLLEAWIAETADSQ
jgi:PilZ domain